MPRTLLQSKVPPLLQATCCLTYLVRGTTGSTCEANGYAPRYGTPPASVYQVPDNFPYMDSSGVMHDWPNPDRWDSSDPRYTFPADHHDPRYALHKPGGTATLIHTVGTAKLWLGSVHNAHEDLEYQNCLNIGALANLHTPELFHEDKYPHWEPWPDTTDRQAFTKYNQNFPAMAQIALPERRWFKHYTELETWVDNKLTAGTSVFLFDIEGTKGAAAWAISYQLRKLGGTYDARYAALKAERPWIDDLEDPEIEHYVANARTFER
eukprot:TRINITY_DN92635_c0_g1_i1.p1 TRINITY_DN92635_c0_g1~~TRINITY_DN92635_c0_g1_i1.p1  ORF type:complete len:266 (+),score=28.99 TRINITY_DN92635_c0_g1_i1:108-905(+)